MGCPEDSLKSTVHLFILEPSFTDNKISETEIVGPSSLSSIVISISLLAPRLTSDIETGLANETVKVSSTSSCASSAIATVISALRLPARIVAVPDASV